MLQEALFPRRLAPEIIQQVFRKAVHLQTIHFTLHLAALLNKNTTFFVS